jgi:hypothetical protein
VGSAGRRRQPDHRLARQPRLEQQRLIDQAFEDTGEHR